MRTLFFTVATTNYLPFAVSLLDSVKLHHPEFEFCICLTDYLNADDMERYSLAKKYPLLQLHEIKAEEFDFITRNYNAMQLANSSKVLFTEYFLKTKEIEQVIFGDSDMLFFDRLPQNVVNEHEIIFTPHFTVPPPIENKSQELEVLNAGMFNGVFFKLKRSTETEKFINWHKERSVLDCIYDFKKGYYGEQLWLNFVPLYFKTAHIEKNKGMNMAYWNLHERTIKETTNGFSINHTSPLSFFHFSGWDYHNPLKVCKWASWDADNRPDLKPLLLKYHEILKANQYERYINIPNYYTAKNNSGKKSFFKKLKRKLFRK